MKRIAIITGATGGIGREFLKQLVNEELDEIWAVARNLQKLNELRESIYMGGLLCSAQQILARVFF